MSASIGTIASAYVQVLPSTKGMKANLTQALNEESREPAAKAGDSIGGTIAGKIKGAIAAIGIAAVIKEGFSAAIEAGSAIEQSFGGLETLYDNTRNGFADASEQIKEYARQAAAYGVSANSYAEQATSFGAALRESFGGDTIKAADAANRAIMDMSDNASKMGTNIEDIQNAYQGFAKGNFTMLDNLKLGFGGTQEGMQALLDKADELNAAQGKTTDYSIDNFGDIVEAIHVVQEDLGIAGNAASEAEETFSGSFEAMKASAENFAAAIATGGDEIDIESSLSDLLSRASTFLFNNAFPMIGNILTGIIQIVVDGLQSFAENGFPESLGSYATAFWTWVTESFIPLLAQLPGAILDALTTVLTTVTENLKNTSSEDVSAGLAEIATIVATWFLEDFLPSLAGFGSALGECVLALLQLVWAVLTDNFPWLQTFVDGVKTVISTSIGIITGIVSTGVSVIRSIIEGIADVVEKVRTVFGDIKEAIRQPIEKARDIVKDAIDRIKGFFDFEWSLPDLKLPHFDFTGSFSLDPPSVPHFSVEWYALGGILTQPTIFGRQGNTLLAGGEAGAEAVLPLSVLKDYIDGAIYDLEDRINAGNAGFVQNLTINSLQPLSPSETARQTRNANQQFLLAMRGL